jgi:hypothetical protein
MTSGSPIYLHYSVACPACKKAFLRTRPVLATDPEEDGTAIDEFWSVCDSCGILLRMDERTGPRRVATQDEIDSLETRSPDFHRKLMDLRSDIELAIHLKQALANIRNPKSMKSKAQFV